MPRENATVATLRSPIGKSSAAHRSAAGLMDAVTKLVNITDTHDDPNRTASSVCPRVPLVCRVVQVDAEGKPISTPSKPRSCALQKPLLCAALLDALDLPATKRLSDGEALEITASVGVGGRDEPIILSKLVARRAALWAMDRHGDRIRASGELSAEQLACPRRLNKALARTAFDLLDFLVSRATEMRTEEEGHALLQLHTTLQRLVGPKSRGCGVVYCAEGKALFERARADAIAASLTLEA